MQCKPWHTCLAAAFDVTLILIVIVTEMNRPSASKSLCRVRVDVVVVAPELRGAKRWYFRPFAAGAEVAATNFRHHRG